MSTPGEPGLAVTELTVNGMCCQSEANLVHKKLGVLPGVTNIRINMLLRQVLVTHEETLDPARLVRTLNWALLDARVTDGSSGGSLLQKGKPSMITWLAAACGVCFAVSLGIWKRVTRGSPEWYDCLLYTSPSPRDYAASRMPSSA